MPQEANYVFDVRFVPNPFYVPELKLLSGRDEPVQEYVRSFEETDSFLASSILFLDFVIPRYLDDERKTFHAAIGCTGGRHRSVAFAEWLFEHYKNATAFIKAGFEAELRHRDIDKMPLP